jgi:hypothetical protein
VHCLGVVGKPSPILSTLQHGNEGLAKAKRLVDGHDIEPWNGAARKLGRRSETNSPMRRADPRARFAVRQVILRQRPSQVCDTNIQGDAATVLGGVPAGLTVFGHSDSSNDDKAKRKYHARNQPNQGRG